MNDGATAAGGRRGDGDRTLVLAHRGAWDRAPQNSLEAVRRAAALGCDGVEIDVRRTADGRLVVVHDGRLGWRAVRRMEHREVQARMAAGQAPLLGDVLDEAAAGGLLVDVELKEDGYVPEAMALIARHLDGHRYVVTSFRPGVLAQVRRHHPDSRTGLLVAPRTARQAPRRMHESGADVLLPHVSLVRSGIVEWAAGEGLAVWVWTVNEDQALRALSADPRVAALITDAPAEALARSQGVDLADSRE
ncbi:MAG TPA: glycerophosphodiester phosphodiesterase [Solirubrobacteraceae bacterium]|jgi:glycerophosphoryl diester phosphodiesterase|nr:glycerophosphodiester phosphodiesterase [Solirubrobacteraceae bacterium]